MLSVRLLTLVGGGLILLGILKGGLALMLAWLGLNLLSVAVAQSCGAHRVFGKRSDGTLPWWSRVIHLPFFCYVGLVWHALRLFGREPPYNQVTSDLVVGRRLLSREFTGEFANYVDLTAEFAEPLALRQQAGYFCYPILDAAAPTPESLKAALSRLRPGRTYVHCAQGHGRAGLFAAALLLDRGEAGTVEEALRLLKTARPGIRPSGPHRKCIAAFAAQLSDH